MKKLILSFLIAFPFLLISQDKVGPVRINAVKAVTVQLPPGYKMNDFHPGLEDKYYTVRKHNDYVLILQATNRAPWPTSNVTIFCDTAIIYFDVIYQEEITQNNYYLSSANAVSTVQPGSTYQAQTSVNDVATPMTDMKISEIEVEDISNTPDDTLYYEKDRLSLGNSFNNGQLLAYINNLYGNDEFINVSLRITNNSNVAYHTDAIDLIITTEVKKKDTKSLADDDPTPYKPLNSFPKLVEPGQSALYIMRFRKFSLDKNNNIKLVAGEGKGRRTVSFEITSKMFYKYIQYY